MHKETILGHHEKYQITQFRMLKKWIEFKAPTETHKMKKRKVNEENNHFDGVPNSKQEKTISKSTQDQHTEIVNYFS